MARRSLRAPDSRPRVLAAVHASAGVRAAYQRTLDAMLAKMQQSLVYWVKAALRANPTPLAQDDNPAARIAVDLGGLSRRWQKAFNQRSRKTADDFTSGARRHTDEAFRQSLKREGFTVAFQMTPAMRTAYQAVLAENVGLIKSIAAEHLQQVQGIVLRGVSAGHDLEQVTTALQHQFGVTKRRAALIARDQSAKATAVMHRARMAELDIKEAIWLHSAGGKEPRPSHVKASGQKYDIAKGMLLDGEWLMPGQAINCRCVSRAIVEGFE